MSREDILRVLRNEFRNNTRERLAEMTALLERARCNPDDIRLRELERHFHGLAGLGGTYGYQSVTELSREAENLCETSFGSPESVDLDRLSAILSAIAREIEVDHDRE
jgi:chemotaxis protein histidine kinase CheA